MSCDCGKCGGCDCATGCAGCTGCDCSGGWCSFAYSCAIAIPSGGALTEAVLALLLGLEQEQKVGYATGAVIAASVLPIGYNAWTSYQGFPKAYFLCCCLFVLAAAALSCAFHFLPPVGQDV